MANSNKALFIGGGGSFGGGSLDSHDHLRKIINLTQGLGPF